ncbi:hypothetical protein GA0115240_13887 [Streptomyces sp. DvalAA-14]|nr:hypothetical protein GA0115240_13887 [Streptomyces sp. DvalAA-14]
MLDRRERRAVFGDGRAAFERLRAKPGRRRPTISGRSMDWEHGVLAVNHQVSAYGCQEISGYRRGVKRGTKHRSFEQARRTPVPESIKEVFNDHIDPFGTWGNRG